MSGGVDSSVAAALLKTQGYEVVGIHLKCFNVDGCAAGDAEDARRAAETLGIPLYVFDFEKEYTTRVVKYMVGGYRRGITPNPDVMCNKEIKFGLFYRKARAMGADFIATGHYVRKSEIRNPKFETNSKLFSAVDKNKDQSYFLWTLTQEILRNCLFPIGDYTKPEVRKMARKFGLPNAEKKDSQGICFLGQVALDDFLADYIPRTRGPLIDVDGRSVGEHRGAAFYTIGQRRLGIRNMALGTKGGGETKPYYVAEKDVRTNTVVLAPEGHESLYKKAIVLANVNCIASSPRANSRGSFGRVAVRVRYRQPVVPARIVEYASGTMNIQFVRPVAFVAPGQSAVLYSKSGELLGGGVIRSAR